MEKAQPDLKDISLSIERYLSVYSTGIVVRVKLLLKAVCLSFVRSKQESERREPPHQMVEYASTKKNISATSAEKYIQLMTSILEPHTQTAMGDKNFPWG